MRLSFLSRPPLSLLDFLARAALEWLRPANADGSGLKQLSTDGIFSDFMSQLEMRRLGGRLLGFLRHITIMP